MKDLKTTPYSLFALFCGLVLMTACNRSSTNHDDNTYSNGNRVTDTSTSYNTNNSQNRGENTTAPTQSTTAGDTVHRGTGSNR